jgi:D-3-phosphoglycerate dehydrogenase / 2-oxoglutarate reductase
MQRRALVLEPDCYPVEVLKRLTDHHVEAVVLSVEDREQLRLALSAARAEGRPFSTLFVRLGVAIDEAILDAAGPSLRWVVTPTTGLAHIDVRATEARDIRVLSLKGHVEFLRSITSTAELTWALLLALVRKLPSAQHDVLQGNWRRTPFLGRELRGLTLGVVGLGRLGSLVAGYGRAFQMRVLGWDASDGAFNRLENAHVERRELDALVRSSDVLSVHLPLDENTKGLVDARLLRLLPRGAIVLNTARGEILDEETLLQLLRAGVLAGAGLDVLSGDSVWERGIPEDHPLLAYAREHDNLLLSPHMGGYSVEAIVRTRAFMVERFCELIASPGNAS